MSPIIDGKVVIYKDSIFRNEQGLSSMAHVTAFMSSMTGVGVVAAGVVAVFMKVPEGLQVLQSGVVLVSAGAGLEGATTYIEGKNKRSTPPHPLQEGM